MYRELNSRDLLKLLKRINVMRGNFHFKETLWLESQDPLKAMRHYVKYYRVYIPKTANTVRPLGVPTRAWRIYQKMWLIPVMGFTGSIIPSTFHGYIPQRGTGTAWQEILRRLIHKRNIFEVDFKGFFPSVPTAELTYALYLEGAIPLSVCVYLHYMNNSLPMFLTKDELPEVHYGEGSEASLVLDQLKLKLSQPVAKERLLSGISTVGLRDPRAKLVESSLDMAANRPYSYKAPQGVVQGIKPAEMPMTRATGDLLRRELETKLPRTDEGLAYTAPKFDLNFEMMKWKGSKGIPLNKPLSETQSVEMWKQLEGRLITASSQYARILLQSMVKFNVGLPQGATLSPYLSILYLEIVLKRLGIPKDVGYLFYADDGLFYSDSYDSLSKWIKQISGHRFFPTSLSHYNIVVHKEKSAWVKIQGEWKKPLKFLGLRFVPKETIGASYLEAATRAKLDAPGSTLVFNKDLLVFYEYGLRLLKGPLDVLESRARLSKTPAMKAYYGALVKLYGVSSRVIGYLYLIASVLSLGVLNFIIFVNSGAPRLKDFGTLKGISDIINLGNKGYKAAAAAERHVLMSDLNIKDQSSIFMAVKWLRGGYDGATHHQSASDTLMRKLEIGLTSVGGHSLPTVLPVSNVNESLRRMMAAPLFFGWSIKELRDEPKVWISRHVGDIQAKVVPLDLYRFLVTLLMPIFGVFVPPMFGFYVTSADKADKTPYWRHAVNWTYIRRYIATHKFTNLANSEYFGLIMSRMYSGSWIPEDLEQSFKFDFKRGSLAEVLQDQDTEGKLNVFVGSSYAMHEMVRLLSYLKRSSRTNAPFRLFKDGFLSEGDWEVSALIELEDPSLAQAFPGAKEPMWHVKAT